MAVHPVGFLEDWVFGDFQSLKPNPDEHRIQPIEASQLAKQAKPFELRFVVDTTTEKAYLLGNAGSSEVELIPNTDGISFVEITRSGNVMVTAITAAGEAVHSRNGIMFKELVPSQFYGKCAKQ